MSRKSQKIITAIALSIGLGLAGCRSAPIEDRAPPVSRLGLASSETSLLETGRSIYTGKCARCHKPKSVQEYAAEDWSARILPKMAKKAKLTTGETDAVLAYVMAVQGVKSGPEPGQAP